MRFLGLTITREKAATSPVDTRSGWYPLVREPFTGAWQKNAEVDEKAVLAFHAVFACMTLIASDIAKLRVKLVQQDEKGIWTEIKNPAYSPVLRKPNSIQTRIQFYESWVLSKLSRGNSYILKGRDNRGVVTSLHVLDPNRVKPMLTDDGAVYYELQADNVVGLEGAVTVPASEIIHDRFNCLFHPLVGISPIYANGLASTQGMNIQNNSANLFANASRPGGLLIAPGRIDPADAQRMKEYWDAGFTGVNSGKVAVLGDGMTFTSLSTDPVDAQMIEQLKWTAEVVCSTFHVPPYKIGVGALPSYNNVQALNVEYYAQCLQSLIESIELCLDEGLSTGERLGTEFDTDNLLRMDSVTQMEVLDRSKSVLTLDERRAKLDRPNIVGGATVYLQEQDHSIEAIAARDALLIAAANAPAEPTAPAAPANDDGPDEAEQAEQRAMAKALLRERIRERVNA